MFAEALKSYRGDVVRLTLTTGEKVAGQLYVTAADDSGDVSLRGEVFTSAVSMTGEQKLVKLDREVYYRGSAIIGVEHLWSEE